MTSECKFWCRCENVVDEEQTLPGDQDRLKQDIETMKQLLSEVRNKTVITSLVLVFTSYKMAVQNPFPGLVSCLFITNTSSWRFATFSLNHQAIEGKQLDYISTKSLWSVFSKVMSITQATLLSIEPTFFWL